MTDLLLLFPTAAPLAAAAGHTVLGPRLAGWLGVACPAALLTAAVALAAASIDTPTRAAMGGVLRVDPLAAFLLVIIGVVALIAAAATPAHLRAETTHSARRHHVLVDLFLAATTLAVLAADLGVLWVAIEATTIVTAFLVGHRRTRNGTEAAWKYVVICSAGIALALLGAIVLAYAASHSPGGHGLDIAALTAAAHTLDPDVTRIAVLLLVLGFGTKAGLAPLHAWLPDAYSQAPAPVTALMSGVLGAVAFAAILRVKVISDAALGPGFARALLAGMAIASLLVAASLLLGVSDYTRMFAYSSIEHLGIAAFGAAVGSPLAVAAVLLHLLGHGIAKSVLFVGAGRLLLATGTSRIDGVRGLAADHPVLTGAIGAAVLALVGFPPFSLFASELGILRAGFASGMGAATATVLALTVVIAATLTVHTSRMLLGDPTETRPARQPVAVTTAMIGGLVLCAVAGLTLGPLGDLVQAAATTLTGTR
ncbi:proton-conducting transporter transmembrane domain-containing protein [Actinokineospora sp. HUAS TT18]|uniref:proton-conducting transporter transmembrane domain-containing protein n=1 Tax=Actinokineospora sp. HUAS TT18 TaxID=3447451 RepID=UPI003F526868